MTARPVSTQTPGRRGAREASRWRARTGRRASPLDDRAQAAYAQQVLPSLKNFAPVAAMAAFKEEARTPWSDRAGRGLDLAAPGWRASTGPRPHPPADRARARAASTTPCASCPRAVARHVVTGVGRDAPAHAERRARTLPGRHGGPHGPSGREHLHVAVAPGVPRTTHQRKRRDPLAPSSTSTTSTLSAAGAGSHRLGALPVVVRDALNRAATPTRRSRSPTSNDTSADDASVGSGFARGDALVFQHVPMQPSQPNRSQATAMDGPGAVLRFPEFTAIARELGGRHERGRRLSPYHPEWWARAPERERVLPHVAVLATGTELLHASPCAHVESEIEATAGRLRIHWRQLRARMSDREPRGASRAITTLSTIRSSICRKPTTSMDLEPACSRLPLAGRARHACAAAKHGAEGPAPRFWLRKRRLPRAFQQRYPGGSSRA